MTYKGNNKFINYKWFGFSENLNINQFNDEKYKKMNNTNFNDNKEKFSILEGIKDLKLKKKHWFINSIYVNDKYNRN